MLKLCRAGLAAFVLVTAAALCACGGPISLPSDAAAAAGGNNDSANTAYGWTSSGQFQ
jgi:predicted small lipoprotein YifL